MTGSCIICAVCNRQASATVYRMVNGKPVWTCSQRCADRLECK